MTAQDDRLAMLIAYVDGELPAAEAARFEAEVATDPALAAEVARHKALAAKVGGAYAPVLEEAIPAQLLAVAAAANDRGGRPRGGLMPWSGMAAALVIGVLTGRAVWPSEAPLVARHGLLVAQNGLDKALTGQLAAEPGAVKVGVSFKTADGRYCRTFQSGADKLAGLACRDDGHWVARTVTAWSPPPATAYRAAASDTPPEVLASVDNLIAGAPLDAAAERAARDKGWR
jgi:hypothetical protein